MRISLEGRKLGGPRIQAVAPASGKFRKKSCVNLFLFVLVKFDFFYLQWRFLNILILFTIYTFILYTVVRTVVHDLLRFFGMYTCFCLFGLFMSLELPVTRVVVRPDGLEANGHCVFEVVFRPSFGVR